MYVYVWACGVCVRERELRERENKGKVLSLKIVARNCLRFEENLMLRQIDADQTYPLPKTSNRWKLVLLHSTKFKLTEKTILSFRKVSV